MCVCTRSSAKVCKQFSLIRMRRFNFFDAAYGVPEFFPYTYTCWQRNHLIIHTYIHTYIHTHKCIHTYSDVMNTLLSLDATFSVVSLWKTHFNLGTSPSLGNFIDQWSDGMLMLVLCMVLLLLLGLAAMPLLFWEALAGWPGGGGGWGFWFRPGWGWRSSPNRNRTTMLSSPPGM